MNTMNQQQERVNVLCLKWGTRYPAYYVNNLYAGVKKYLHRPFRFICSTDDPIGLDKDIEVVGLPPDPGITTGYPTIFMKLLVFKDGFASLQGPTLFLDIDIAITGDLDCFFEYKLEKNCIIQNWIEGRKAIVMGRPKIGNSSVFRFEAGKSNYIYEKFIQEMDNALNTSLFRTEQVFLTYAMGEVYWWPDEWVRSFKRHSMWAFPLNYLLSPILPDKCRVLVFHGKPDPDEVLVGYKGKRLHHYCKPAQWLKTYWTDSNL